MRRYHVLVTLPQCRATFQINAINAQQAEWLAGIYWPTATQVQVRD